LALGLIDGLSAGMFTSYLGFIDKQAGNFSSKFAIPKENHQENEAN